MKSLRSLAIAPLFLLAAAFSAAEEPKITLNVQPGIEEPVPAVRLSSTTPMEDIFLRVYTIDSDASRNLYSEWPLSGYTETSYSIPSVQRDTYFLVTAEKTGVEKPLLEWTTLRRPDGVSMMDYQGLQEMLPPDDFDEYWARAKAQLAQVPMNARVTEVPEKHTETGLLFRVDLDTLGDTSIVCWYTVPRAAFDAEGNVVNQYPTMVVMPGYGAEQPPMDRTPDGLITLSINPRNHGPSQEYWKSPVAHLAWNIEDPENQYYKYAFMDCIRGLDFVASRAEVDTTRIAAEGGSQGGLFSVALAALDDRIACVVSNVTAFANFADRHYLALVGTQNSYRNILNDPERDHAAVLRSMALFDAVNMATRVHVPVQINMGGQDPNCPYVTGIVLYNRLPEGTVKEFNIFPDVRHAVPAPIREKNAEWIQRWFGLESKPSLPGKLL